MSQPGSTEKNLVSARKKKGTLIAALIDPEDFSMESASQLAQKVQKLRCLMHLHRRLHNFRSGALR